MDERRSSRRSPIELAASFGIGEDPRPEKEVKINDISAGGFCFNSENKLKVGQVISVAIDLSTSEQIVVNVVIVWVKEIAEAKQFRVGAQFLETEGPDFEKFLSFYNSQL